MASPTYLKLKGKRQGDIKGDVAVAGQKDKIQIIAVSHDIVSPRDIASGLATGKRMHKPFIITKLLDSATPKLYNALVSNEDINEFEMQFFGKKPDGTETHLFTVNLSNATVVSIHFEKPNVLNAQNATLTEFEVVAFTYQSIEWKFEKGGIMASDDWQDNT
jgi:type VI secretion system secreted protein Hcp